MRGEYGAQPTQISIHAPARGATVGKDANVLADVISIHAPARGATLDAVERHRSGVFQSALPRGERLRQLQAFLSFMLFQSALPRGERLVCILSGSL